MQRFKKIDPAGTVGILAGIRPDGSRGLFGVDSSHNLGPIMDHTGPFSGLILSGGLLGRAWVDRGRFWTVGTIPGVGYLWRW